MSDETITVELVKRETLGKGLVPLRADGKVPAVVHDHGKPSIHVTGDLAQLGKVYSRAGKHHPVELTVDGKHHLALIKDVDYEPAKHTMRHVVFQAIKQNEKVTAEVPVVLTGDEIPAERKSLLVLQQLDTIQIEALPKDLPDQLSADASTLAEVGDRLTVADIKAPAGVTILTEPEHSLAIVEMPKDQIAEADAAQASLAEDAEKTGEAESKEASEPEAENESKQTSEKKPQE
jgi:large subunit ribosomal protein L25